MQLTDALAARERAEADARELIERARVQLSGVQRLTALVPYCSACQFDVTIPADARSIGTITDGVTQLLRERQWSEAEIMGVELAVQEAVANAIRHGCGGDPSKQIQCILTVSETGEVTVVVRDPGDRVRHRPRGRPAAPGQRPEDRRPRHLPDQPADGRSRVQRRRTRAADAQAPRVQRKHPGLARCRMPGCRMPDAGNRGM